eukprot:GGOE01001090.1.p1 GENE.GGOE01001090.1~~GGOE01001090.1.p1  ORF type:complete len:315 (-),score=102.87 GGOE01001090.1:269-1165(-)
MDHFNKQLEKLSSLQTMGILTAEEYEQRRKQLVDDFVHKPTVVTPKPAAARPPRARPMGLAYTTYAVPSFAPPTTYHDDRLHGHGKGFGTLPRGPYTNVGFSQPICGARFSPYPRKPRGPSNAIKVQPIPDGTSIDDLKSVFSVYGSVIMAVIKEGDPRHAYVNFNTVEEANAAAGAKYIDLHGQTSVVTMSFRARNVVAEGEPTSGIGIFNMPFTMTYDEVHAMLAQYPGFQNLKYVTNKSGEFRGYVFAYFDSVENATYAKGQLLGVNIGEQVLDVKFSNKSEAEAFKDVPGALKA